MDLKIRRRFAKENDVTLFRGDCLKLLKKIPTGTARLIITSPPYNIGKAYEKRQPLSDYLAFQKEVIKECIRTLRKDGSICWQVVQYVIRKGQVLY